MGRANLSPLTSVNDNFNAKDPDVTLKNETYTGGQLKAETSEFKRVLKRRKSRQSVNAPNVLSVDFVGNSGAFSHMINKDAT